MLVQLNEYGTLVRLPFTRYVNLETILDDLQLKGWGLCEDCEVSGGEMGLSFQGTLWGADEPETVIGVAVSITRRDDMRVYVSVFVSTYNPDPHNPGFYDQDMETARCSLLRPGIDAMGALLVTGEILRERIGELV